MALAGLLVFGLKPQTILVGHQGKHDTREPVRRFGAGGPVCLGDAGAGRTGQLLLKRLALLGQTEQPLPPVDRAFGLGDISGADQFTKHPAQTLFGDFEDLKQLGDGNIGMTTDEIEHPMVRAAKTQGREQSIRFRNKVAVREKQQLHPLIEGLFVQNQRVHWRI